MTTPSIVSAQESQKNLDAAQDLSHDTETALATLKVTTDDQTLGEGTTFIYPDRGELQGSNINAEQWEESSRPIAADTLTDHQISSSPRSQWSLNDAADFSCQAPLRESDVENHLLQLRKQRIRGRNSIVYIPPQAKADLHAPDQSRFPLVERVQEFLDSDQTVLLLLGDSGGGKSTFNRALELDLWQAYNDTGIIPLYINLPTIDNPDQELIVKQLRKLEFTEQQIRQLKGHRQFILICDGYDESLQNRNLYTSNQLNEVDGWAAKMVISCRTEYIGRNYRNHFEPSNSQRRSDQKSLLQEAVITPFSTDQIQAYISQYVAVRRPLWETKDYIRALDFIPGLMDLVKNPFLLTISLEVLPRMMDPGATLSDANITKVILYDHFIEQWLERGKERLEDENLSLEAKASLKNLSNEEFTRNGIDYMKKLSVAIYKEQDGQPVVDYSCLDDSDTWKEDFFSRDEEKQLLREACPLVRTGNQHRFIHRSLLEYGLARAVFDPQHQKEPASESVQQESTSLTLIPGFEESVKEAASAVKEQHPVDPESPLVWRDLVNEPSILQFLSERVKQEHAYKHQLLTYIEHSKKDKRWRKAAANAITILVQAGVQFINADLQAIQIPGANISKGVFDSAQLQGANLRGVNFRGAWLRQTNLSRSKMAGVQFGELPFLTQDGEVRSCSYSPDGSLLAVGLISGSICIYLTSSWERTRILQGHLGTIRCIVFSPNGNRIVSSGDDMMVRLWNVESGETLHVLEGHGHWVPGVAYSPRGEQIASGSVDGTIKLWDAATGVCLNTLFDHEDEVLCVVYSPDGDQLASSSADLTIRLWDVQSGSCSRILYGHSSWVWDVAYSPDGDQIASSSEDKTARLWDIETGTCRRILTGHSNAVFSVVYSPKGDQVATGSKDAAIRLWDVDTGVCRHTLTGHNFTVFSVVFSPRGDQLASGSMDKTVRLWDVSGKESSSVSGGHSTIVVAVRCSPKGDLVASCSTDNTIRLWEMETGTCHRILSGHRNTVTSVCFSPQADRIASSSNDESVRLWDVVTGACLYIMTNQGNWIPADPSNEVPSFHIDWVNDVAYSPQGNQIASASLTCNVSRWNALTGEYRGTLEGHSDGLMSVIYSPSGDQIASGSKDCTIRIWDTETGFCSRVLVGHTKWVRCVVYSSQGDLLASAGYDNIVRIWNMETGESYHTLIGHSDRVTCVAFSSLGHLLASGSWDKTVRIWDVATGQCRAEIQNIQGSVHGVAWNATYNTNYLITGSYDGSVLKWEVMEDEGQCRVRLCWSATNGALAVTGASIQGVRGLTGLNKQLLKQRGAIGEPEHLSRDANK